MVGLPAIAEFTHHMEAVLDRIRSNKLGVDSDLTSTLLEAARPVGRDGRVRGRRAPIPAPVELVQRLIGLLSEAPLGHAQDARPPLCPWLRSYRRKRK